MLLINRGFAESILMSGFYSFTVARSLPNVNNTECSCTYLNGELTRSVEGDLLGAAAAVEVVVGLLVG